MAKHITILPRINRLAFYWLLISEIKWLLYATNNNVQCALFCFLCLTCGFSVFCCAFYSALTIWFPEKTGFSLNLTSLTLFFKIAALTVTEQALLLLLSHNELCPLTLSFWSFLPDSISFIIQIRLHRLILSSVEKLCILSDSPRVIQLWVSPAVPCALHRHWERPDGFLHTLLCGSPSVPACGSVLLSATFHLLYIFQVFSSNSSSFPFLLHCDAPSFSHHELLVHIPVCIFLLSPFGVDHISWLPKDLSLFCLFV